MKINTTLYIDVEAVLNCTESWEGELTKRAQKIFDWALEQRKKERNPERVLTERHLSSLTKPRLIELILRYYDEGMLSLVSFTTPPPREPTEQMKTMYALLEAYKRKVDELMPEGETFVPDRHLLTLV